MNNISKGFNIDSNNKREKRIYEDFNPYGYNYLINKKNNIDDKLVYSKTCGLRKQKKNIKK